MLFSQHVLCVLQTQSKHRFSTGVQQPIAKMGNHLSVCTLGAITQLWFCTMCKMLKIISSTQGLLGKRKWLDRNLLIRSNYTHLVSPNGTVLTTTPSQNKPTVILQQKQQQQESHWILKYIVLLLWRDKKKNIKSYSRKALNMWPCASAPGMLLFSRAGTLTLLQLLFVSLNVLSTTSTTTKNPLCWKSPLLGTANYKTMCYSYFYLCLTCLNTSSSW